MLRFRKKQKNKIEKITENVAVDQPADQPDRFWKKLARFANAALIVAIILELAIFNYASFILVGGGYITKTFSLTDTKNTGLEQDPNEPNVYTATSERPTIEISSIQQRVRTLCVDVTTEKEDHYELCVELEYTDSTRTSTNNSPKVLKIVPKLERTKYTTCSYFGETSVVRMTLQVSKGEKLHISNIRVNERIPFNISFVRILLLVIISSTIYVLMRAPSFQIKYNKKNKVQRSTLVAVVITFLVMIVGTYAMYCSSSNNPFRKSGDQISQELVDAFKHGQVSLLEKPSQELLNMENPYDLTARSDLKVNYKWDHLLYNGKYYSYYGIAPVLLLFLPYHLITGFYLPSNIACLFFSLVGAFFLSCAYIVMMRNWFRKTPFWLMICGLIIVLMSCGILFCVYRPMFYETAESAGFMFFATGVYALFASGICTKQKIRLSRLAISSLCISLAVLSRPTFALYAVAVLFWLGYGFLQYRKVKMAKLDAAGYLMAALLPYVLLGGLQMGYNYARFGSFFEFGIRYSLTINDFTHTEFFPEMAFVSLWNLLFSIPIVKSTFPFFHGNVDKWGLNGYIFTETVNTFGLFIRALPLFSYIYAPRVLRRLDQKEKIRMLLLCVIPGLIVPIILIISTWESGIALRYNVDFAWQMILLALAIIFFVYNGIKNTALRRVLAVVMIACTVFCVIANLALVFQSIPSVTNTVFRNQSSTILYYKIGRLLEFWN